MWNLREMNRFEFEIKPHNEHPGDVLARRGSSRQGDMNVIYDITSLTWEPFKTFRKYIINFCCKGENENVCL